MTCRQRNVTCMDKVHHAVRPPKGLRDIENLEVGVRVGTPSRDRNCMLIESDSGSRQPIRLKLRNESNVQCTYQCLCRRT